MLNGIGATTLNGTTNFDLPTPYPEFLPYGKNSGYTGSGRKSAAIDKIGRGAHKATLMSSSGLAFHGHAPTQQTLQVSLKQAGTVVAFMAAE